MHRCDFLKLTGLFSAALFVQINPLDKVTSLPVEAQAGGKIYRGAKDGRIYASVNAGKTWQTHTDFGNEFCVMGLIAPARENVQAEFAFGGHSFRLALSPNSKVWQTA